MLEVGGGKNRFLDASQFSIEQLCIDENSIIRFPLLSHANLEFATKKALLNSEVRS